MNLAYWKDHFSCQTSLID